MTKKKSKASTTKKPLPKVNTKKPISNPQNDNKEPRAIKKPLPYNPQSSNSLLVLPIEVLEVIIKYTIEPLSFKVSKKTFTFIRDLSLISDTFSAIMSKDFITEIIKWEKLLYDNKQITKVFGGYDMNSFSRATIRLPVWEENGDWSKGMFIKRDSDLIPYNKKEIVNIYYSFSRDIEQLLDGVDLSIMVGSHTSFKSYKFFIRKCDKVVKLGFSDLNIFEDRPYELDSYKSLEGGEVFGMENMEKFWEGFFDVSRQNVYHDILDFADNIREKCDKKMAEDLYGVFESHFPGKNGLYYSKNTASEWVGHFFFIGEMKECIMGLWFFGERDS